jgi:uncharacterized protein
VNTSGQHAPGVALHEKGCVISLTVMPRSPVNRLEIHTDGTIRVKLTAPPVDGAANAGLLKFMAKVLDVPRSKLRILAGSQSRYKRLLVEGISPDSLCKRLSEAAGKGS